jgi:hypothetical protein
MMRMMVLLVAIALPLAACGKSGEDEGAGGGSEISAEAISSNDITAIDAVTGEAANIAADTVIDANLIAGGNGSGTASGDGQRQRRPARPGSAGGNPAPAPANDAAPAPEPQANSAE